MEIVKKAIVEIFKPRALGFLSDARFREKMDTRTQLVYNKIDDKLTEFDMDWHDLKSFRALLPNNSFRNYLCKKYSALRIERIEMREELLKTLLNQST